MNRRYWPDYVDFARAQLSSTDIDPVYAVLHDYLQRFPLEQRIWFCYLYVTYYHLNSAELLFEACPQPHIIDASYNWHLNTGIERRGFRGNRLALDNIKAMMQMTKGELTAWLERSVQSGWQSVRSDFEQIKYNGSWASYKWADLVKHVLGYPLVAPDIGLGGKGINAGPVPGMVLLTGETWQECASNIDLQQRLFEACKAANIPFAGLEQMETTLCDFNSLVKGRYYVGHDIDQMMSQLSAQSFLWQSRQHSIPAQYLGELGGWNGVRKAFKTKYRDEGILLL